MAFPDIKHCLVCEDVRFEKRRLASVLGFYGIAPDVEMLVRNFAEPVLRLCFLLIGEGGQGNFVLKAEIKDETNAVIAPPPGIQVRETRVSIVESSRRSFLAFGFGPILLPRAGAYTFVLIVDGQTNYQNTFRVAQGQPADFE